MTLAGLVGLLPTGGAGAAGLGYKPGAVAEITTGKVEGTIVHDGKALLWQGIPYAKPPVGALRWKAPQAPEVWSDVFDARKAGAVCPQFLGGKVIGAEDCLNLDVYRPNSDATGLPVLVYIHGGNNQTGTSKEIDAKQLAVAANAVVVSVNYRLGLLGFNALPAVKTGAALEDSGNFTLLDISRSLTWVRDNIAAFGGNADNVTISGFSAGGRDVMALLISPLFAGQFHKAISFSGGMTVADKTASAKVDATAAAALVVEDKVKPTEEAARDWLLSSDPAVTDYLRGLSAERIAKLMPNAGIRMAVFPHLFNDGTVLPTNGFRTSRYNAVPLIMLTGKREFSLFARGDTEFGGLKDPELLANPDALAAFQFSAKYGGKLYEAFNALDSAEAMAAHYPAPIYNGVIAWGEDPATAGAPLATLYGSFHGVWIPFATNEATGFSALHAAAFTNAGAKDLGVQMRGYLTNFLWRGNPNGGDLVAWAPWAKGGPTQLVFDASVDKARIAMSSERIDGEAVLKEIAADTTLAAPAKAKVIANVLSGRWFSRGLDKRFGNTTPWIGVD